MNGLSATNSLNVSRVEHVRSFHNPYAAGASLHSQVAVPRDELHLSCAADSKRVLQCDEFANIADPTTRVCLTAALTHAVHDENYAARAVTGITDNSFRIALARNTKSNRVLMLLALNDPSPDVARAILGSTTSPKVASAVDAFSMKSVVENTLAADAHADNADMHAHRAQTAATAVPTNWREAQLAAQTAHVENINANSELERSELCEDAVVEFTDAHLEARHYINSYNAERHIDDQFHESFWERMAGLPAI